MKKSLASLTTFKYIGTKTCVYVTIFGVSKKMRNVMNSILILSSKPINDTELKVLILIFFSLPLCIEIRLYLPALLTKVDFKLVTIYFVLATRALMTCYIMKHRMQSKNATTILIFKLKGKHYHNYTVQIIQHIFRYIVERFE